MKEAIKDEVVIIDKQYLFLALDAMEKLAQYETEIENIDRTVDMVYCRINKNLSKKQQTAIATQIFDKLLIKIGE